LDIVISVPSLSDRFAISIVGIGIVAGGADERIFRWSLGVSGLLCIFRHSHFSRC
jgi:hypothetical protein